MPIKNNLKFGKKGAWAYLETAEIFSVGLPPIISGTGKATNFKFSTCTHILNIDRNKSPLQISGKVAVGGVRSLNFSRHPYIGRIARSSLGQLSFLVTYSCQLMLGLLTS